MSQVKFPFYFHFSPLSKCQLCCSGYLRGNFNFLVSILSECLTSNCPEYLTCDPREATNNALWIFGTFSDTSLSGGSGDHQHHRFQAALPPGPKHSNF